MQRERRALARLWTRIATRGAILAIGGVSIYLLAPSLVAVFSSWRQLSSLSPAWLGAMVVLEAASFVSLWELQRIAVRTHGLFAIGMSQLAGNAFGRIVPGGLAASSALQYQMLTRIGVPQAAVATGLPAASALSIATLLALPVFSVPAMVAGTPVDRSLVVGAVIGLGVCLSILACGLVFASFDRPLRALVGGVEWLLGQVGRRGRPPGDLTRRALLERDSLRRALGSNWWRALLAAVGNTGLDYFALLAALTAAGSRAPPSFVLLAYVTSVLLGLVPFTPGGLGFVEAGLTATLVLAGVSATDAVVATLAYRLVSFWLPIPAGLVGYGLYRVRYPRSKALVRIPPAVTAGSDDEGPRGDLDER